MILPPRLNLDAVVSSSFRDFHAKGLDYLCLKRSEAETIKIYFFDRDAAEAPEVVAPHNHRYPFSTLVLRGRLTNRRYRRVCWSEAYSRPYERFAYMTPLNGGSGFTWEAEEHLELRSEERYGRQTLHFHLAPEIHTISAQAGTVLLLRQQADVIPLDRPTYTWLPAGKREPPSLSGLYRYMGPDHAKALITTAYALAGQDQPVIE